MHEFKLAQPAMPAVDLEAPAGPRPGFEHGDGLDPRSLPEPLPGEPKPRARRSRRRRWIGREAASPQERRRRAAVQLRKAYGRIKSDFSEAYEHCRNDAQRRALERAHRSAREAHARALQDRQFDDDGGWSSALEALRENRARAVRHLARLVTADAVMRILKRLAEMEEHLAALAG